MGSKYSGAVDGCLGRCPSVVDHAEIDDSYMFNTRESAKISGRPTPSCYAALSDCLSVCLSVTRW